MKSVTFDCEVITPMFMAGADGKTPELRPSEFKGMIRFWWRAMKAENDIDKLRKDEAEIFGSSDKKIGKAKFLLRIMANNLKINNYSPLPHSATKNFKFKEFSPGQKFTIVLSARNNDEKYGNIFEISLLIGGFGKRSRRGFGSIHYVKWNFIDVNAVRDYILCKLSSINDDFKIQNSKIMRKSSVSAEYPYIKQISFGTYESDFNNLLKKIGQASHNHKNNALGSGNPRMASPIYVSTIKINKGFIPVITTLNSAFPQNYSCNIQKQNDFIRVL